MCGINVAAISSAMHDESAKIEFEGATGPVNMTTRCENGFGSYEIVNFRFSSESSGCAVSSDIIAHVGTWDSNNHLALNRSELRFSRGEPNYVPEDGTPKPSSITFDEASWISSRREVCIKHIWV